MKRIFLFASVICFLLFSLLFSACAQPQTEVTPPSSSEQETTNDADENDKENEMTDIIYLTINGKKIAVKIEKNSATAELVRLLKESDITYTASDYGGFEKVGNLGHTLPHNDVKMTTEAGDVILYTGNQIVLFYGSNYWSYTRLGKVQVSAEEWKEILTESDSVTVKITLQ